MNQKIGQITLMVNDYQEAIDFYTEKLDFQLITDMDMGNGNRWVLVAPKGSIETQLVLAKDTSGKAGNQTDGRVFLFLHTDDFERDYLKMKENEIIFHEEPRYEPYGTVAVFEDLYGNKWDLIQPK